MIKTDHAKIRQQQRHITNDDIDFLFKYGVQVRQPHDCAIVHLSKKGKKIAKELDIKPEKILKKVFKIEKLNLNGSIEDISEWDSFAHFQPMDSI